MLNRRFMMLTVSAAIHVVVSCLLLVTTTVVITMVIIVVFYTKTNNYDQLLVNKPPTKQQMRNCHVIIAVVAVLWLLPRRAHVYVVATNRAMAALGRLEINNREQTNNTQTWFVVSCLLGIGYLLVVIGCVLSSEQPTTNEQQQPTTNHDTIVVVGTFVRAGPSRKKRCAAVQREATLDNQRIIINEKNHN